MPRQRATRNSWSSSKESLRTTLRPPRGPRRCSFPAFRASKSRTRGGVLGGAGVLRGSGLYNALGRVFLALFPSRGLRIAPSKGCAGPWVVRPCLPPVGRARSGHDDSCNIFVCSAHRLLSWGRSFLSLLGSGPSLCPGPIPQGQPAPSFVDNGAATRPSLIPP